MSSNRDDSVPPRHPGFLAPSPIREGNRPKEGAYEPPKTVWDFLEALNRSVADLENAAELVVSDTCPVDFPSAEVLLEQASKYSLSDVRHVLKELLGRVDSVHDSLVRLHREIK